MAKKTSSYKWRLQVARKLLESKGELSISEIAYHFDTSFSVAYGVARGLSDLYDDVIYDNGKLYISNDKNNVDKAKQK